MDMKKFFGDEATWRVLQDMPVKEIGIEDYFKQENDHRLDGYVPGKHTSRMSREEFSQRQQSVANAGTDLHRRLSSNAQLYFKQVAACSIGRSLGLTGEELREFTRCASDKNADKEIVGRMKEEVKIARSMPGFSEQMLNSAVMNAIEEVHDLYRQCLLDEMGSSPRGEKYVLGKVGFQMLTPIELSGVCVAKDHFNDHIKSITDQIGIRANWREEFYERCGELFKNCDIAKPNSQYYGVEDYLMSENIAGCGSLTFEGNMERVYGHAMPDLIAEGFGADVHLREFLEKNGIQYSANEFKLRDKKEFEKDTEQKHEETWQEHIGNR